MSIKPSTSDKLRGASMTIEILQAQCEQLQRENAELISLLKSSYGYVLAHEDEALTKDLLKRIKKKIEGRHDKCDESRGNVDRDLIKD